MSPRRGLAASVVLIATALACTLARADEVDDAVAARDATRLRTLYYSRLHALAAPPKPGESGGAQEFEAFLASGKPNDWVEAGQLVSVLPAVKGGTAVDEPDEKPKSVFDRLAAKGFHLRRASEGPKKRDPALLEYERDEVQDDDAFRAQFYLSYDPGAYDLSPTVWVRPHASVEGNLSSLPAEQNQNETSAFRIRAGATGTAFGSTCPRGECWYPDVRGLAFSGVAKFDSSQDSDIQKFSFEASATPVDSRLGMGVVSPPWRDPNVSFFWQPTFFVEGGSTILEGESFERGNEFFRVGTTVRASVHFDALMRLLGLRGSGVDEGSGEVPSILPHLFVEWTGRWSFAEEDQLFEHVAAGVHLPFNANVSLDVLYEQGDAAPSFQFVHRVSVGLGIQF